MTEEQKAFLLGQDFMKLGHNISAGQWNLAMNTLRRMQMKCKEIDMDSFDQLLRGIQAACRSGNREEALQLMTRITAKRVQLRNQMYHQEQEKTGTNEQQP